MKGLTNDEIAQALSMGSVWPTVEPGDAADGSVEWIQTHISHVFLVGDRVFKLRKDVKLPFLDFSTRELRNADCQRAIIVSTGPCIDQGR